MKQSDFCHLHLHTQYSLLDGAIRYEPLIEKAREYGMTSLVMTDHGNMFGAVAFYRKIKAAGIKPIIGCEVYIAPGNRRDKSSQDGISDTSYHLILLAKDHEGYQNLSKLVSIGYLEGFYYRPRIDREVLEKHSGGLIALGSCMKGEVSRLILTGREEKARESAIYYRDLMGEDGYYLEIQDQGIPEQKGLNKKLIEFSRELSIPLVATNDCHYMTKEEARAHDVLLCIQTGKKLSDEKRMRLTTDNFYFRSPDEMKALFPEVPDAIANTVKIAERCNLELRFDQIFLPEYEVPSDITLNDYLEETARHALEKRFLQTGVPDEKRELYYERLKEELVIINKMGYAGYFLIVWDFIAYARKVDIPVGPGRGSAAGSLVAYVLAITDIDPMPYDLLFERFLNPERVSMPDIDIDFCMDRREEVIEYVTKKYGKKNVSQIITFGRMNAKGVLRDVGRVMGVEYSDVDKIAKLVPDRLKITLKEAVKEEKRLEALIKSDKKLEEVLNIAMTLEGMPRHASTHAAGIVIAPKPLTEYVPLYAKGDDVSTQYTMIEVEKLGLLKMDFLGLRTLTVIRKTEDLIKKSLPDFSVEAVPLDDRPTYDLLGEGRTLGVFQLESSGLRDILKRLRPEVFEDLIAIVALYRPGPLGSGMVDDFIKRKHGTVEIHNIIPELDDILRDTYGVIVYQEQVMKIASVVGGFSLGGADLMRRAMGKKDDDEMARLKELFISGAKEKKIDPTKAKKIFELIGHFAGYGFNKSHSAAYALVSYRTAYLKAHYPKEFIASLISSEMDNTDKVMQRISECREMDIEVLPPDINKSQSDFSVVDGKIRFGLAAVKNVGANAVAEIVRGRLEKGRFNSLLEMWESVDPRVVNRKVVESLTKCGAFDLLGSERGVLFANLDNVLEAAQRVHRDKKRGQISLFDGFLAMDEKSDLLNNENPWSDRERLSFEKETLGFYITGHPLERYVRDIKHFTNSNTKKIKETPSEGSTISIAGVISAYRVLKTKKGSLMAFGTLEDMQGSVEIVIFPKLYETVSELIEGDEPIWVKGVVKEEEGPVKILCEELYPLVSIRDHLSASVHVSVQPVGMEESLLDELKRVFETHKGDSPLFLHIPFPDESSITIHVDSPICVVPSDDLLCSVEGILGDDSIYFE